MQVASAAPCMRSVISDAYVAGNDEFESFCRCGGKLGKAFIAETGLSAV
jgi:hypothetical protein